jgi:hypothetical protein
MVPASASKRLRRDTNLRRRDLMKGSAGSCGTLSRPIAGVHDGPDFNRQRDFALGDDPSSFALFSSRRWIVRMRK